MHRRTLLAAALATAALPRVLRAAQRLAAGDLYALVLGSVQDGGFPQAGCYTPRCDEGRALLDSGHGRFVSSLALVEPAAERFYLVDATSDITPEPVHIRHAPSPVGPQTPALGRRRSF